MSETEALPLTGERTAPGIPSENYWFRRHVAAYRFAARFAEGTVVDAGCGEGYGGAILAGSAHRVVSLDLDQPTLAHAKRRYGRGAVVGGDLGRLPLPTASVDAIVALQVIEHLADAEAFVEDARRALRPGGCLVVSTPNRDTFPAGLNPFHTHEYEAGELRDLVSGRFEDVRLLGLGHGARLRWMDRALGEPIQDLLVRTPYRELPVALRAALRSVTARSFRVTSKPERALDLLAVCRSAPGDARPRSIGR